MSALVAKRPFTRINGWPVAIGIALQLIAMQLAFLVVFGCNLLVRSGIRTYAEQEKIFRERYTLTPSGRYVYDVRRWNGQLWYRIDPTGTVAAPGTSNHETGRSLDLYDDGPGPGVGTSFTSERNRWLSANCHRWGFTHTGRNFGEPWHFEQLEVADPWLGLPKPTSIDPSDPGQVLTEGGQIVSAPSPAPQGAHQTGDIDVESYILTADDSKLFTPGQVMYIRPGVKKVFASADDYRAWVTMVNGLRSAGQTSMIAPPALTKLVALPDWAVSALLTNYDA